MDLTSHHLPLSEEPSLIIGHYIWGTMDTRPRMIYLPDTMTDWPWPRAINPHFEAVKMESNDWFHSFKTLSPKLQETFNKSDPGPSYFSNP